MEESDERRQLGTRRRAERESGAGKGQKPFITTKLWEEIAV